MAKKKANKEKKPEELVANCDRFKEAIAKSDYPENTEIVLSQYEIEQRILTIRGKQVLIDRDLASIYGVSTKRLNEQVRRNIARFPERYRFQLTKKELMEVVANCDRLKTLKFSTTEPFVLQNLAFQCYLRFLTAKKQLTLALE